MDSPVEFRVPISPTLSFYRRIHLFCAALRRLGTPYAEALVRVVVGDNPDLDDVRKANAWAENYPVTWHAVPPEIFEQHHYFGTADFRYLLPPPSKGVVVLMDADSVVVNPLLDALSWMRQDQPAIAGHMAHLPPPVKRAGEPIAPDQIWPFLFQQFGIPWPDTLYSYSMDSEEKWSKVPAYYNLGFIALNRAALRIFSDAIFEVQDKLKSMIESGMRCQIACTLISYAHQITHQNLPATFNAANDFQHLDHNAIRICDIRVIHYLRKAELSRESFLSWKNRETFLRQKLENPVNQLLQRVIAELPEL